MTTMQTSTPTSSSTSPTAPAGRPRGRRGARRLTGGRAGFALPGVLLLAALSVYPVYLVLSMSVHKVSAGTVNGIWSAVGAQNFRALAADPAVAEASVHTAVFVGIVTVLGVVGGFLAAVVLRSSRPASAFLLAMMVFVWALPPVVNGSVWKFLLADQGLINSLLRSAGFTEAGVPFLFDQRFALVSVALVNSWAVIPFNALVFRAALLAVPPELLEAAAIDGASRARQVRHVLLPSSRPTAVVLTILTIVYAFRSFDFIYVMTSGGPGTATTTLPFLSYTQAFVERDYGIGSATAVVSLAIVAALAVVYTRITQKETR